MYGATRAHGSACSHLQSRGSTRRFREHQDSPLRLACEKSHHQVSRAPVKLDRHRFTHELCSAVAAQAPRTGELLEENTQRLSRRMRLVIKLKKRDRTYVP